MVIRRISNNELYHYGVKGMKWKHHKKQEIEVIPVSNKTKDELLQPYYDELNELNNGRNYSRSIYSSSVPSSVREALFKVRNHQNKVDAERKKFIEQLIVDTWNGKYRRELHHGIKGQK